jgi:hypothetical protein
MGPGVKVLVGVLSFGVVCLYAVVFLAGIVFAYSLLRKKK